MGFVVKTDKASAFFQFKAPELLFAALFSLPKSGAQNLTESPSDAGLTCTLTAGRKAPPGTLRKTVENEQRTRLKTS